MASEPRNTPTRGTDVIAPLPSLAAKATTGTGTAFNLPKAASVFGLQVIRATTGASGGSTSATIQLQGSIDGTNYAALGGTIVANTTTGSNIARSTNAIPVNYVRLNINSFTTDGGSTHPNYVAVNGYISVGIGSS